MKIGLVIPYLRDIAGGEHVTMAVAAGLQKMGHDVKIYCYTQNPDVCFPRLAKQVKIISLYDARKDAASVHERIHSNKRALMPLLAPFRPYYELFMMRRLAGLIDTDREILCAVNQPSEWAASAAAARLKIPWVWLCLEPPFYFDERIPKSMAKRLIPWPIYHIWDKRAAQSASKLITLSRTFKPYIDNLYGVDCGYIHLPHLPGATTVLAHEAKSTQTPRSSRAALSHIPFRALFVASYSVYKRPQDVVEAMKYLPPQFELDLIGEGYLQKELEEQIARLHLDGRVRLVPRVPEEELAKYYSRADVFICTSEQSWGLVALDAIERGVPVIISPACGVSEILQDNRTALLVPDRNPKAIAEKMKWLAAHPKEAQAIVEAAQKVLKGMTVEKYCQELLNDFTRALPPPPKPPA